MANPDAMSRVYVDMVGDLFHAGHVALLREARHHGDWLVVGVLSDDTAASYKRRPIMTLAERVAVIESCRYVDEVIEDAPFQLTEAFLDEHAVTTVVHGDDLSPEGRGRLRARRGLREVDLRSAHRRNLNHPAHPARARCRRNALASGSSLARLTPRLARVSFEMRPTGRPLRAVGEQPMTRWSDRPIRTAADVATFEDEMPLHQRLTERSVHDVFHGASQRAPDGSR